MWGTVHARGVRALSWQMELCQHNCGGVCVCARARVCVRAHQLGRVLQERQQRGLQDGSLLGAEAVGQRQQQHQQLRGAPQADQGLLQTRLVLLCSIRQRHHLWEGGGGQSPRSKVRQLQLFQLNPYISGSFAFLECVGLFNCKRFVNTVDLSSGVSTSQPVKTDL